jgi:hypothetical protein
MCFSKVFFVIIINYDIKIKATTKRMETPVSKLLEIRKKNYSSLK